MTDMDWLDFRWYKEAYIVQPEDIGEFVHEALENGCNLNQYVLDPEDLIRNIMPHGEVLVFAHYPYGELVHDPWVQDEPEKAFGGGYIVRPYTPDRVSVDAPAFAALLGGVSHGG